MSIMNDEQNDPNQIESIVKNIKISNETLSNGYEYTKFENQKASPDQRKLILHFDNRNTLQVTRFSFSFSYLFTIVLLQGCK